MADFDGQGQQEQGSNTLACFRRWLNGFYDGFPMSLRGCGHTDCSACQQFRGSGLVAGNALMVPASTIPTTSSASAFVTPEDLDLSNNMFLQIRQGAAPNNQVLDSAGMNNTMSAGENLDSGDDAAPATSSTGAAPPVHDIPGFGNAPTAVPSSFTAPPDFSIFDFCVDATEGDNAEWDPTILGEQADLVLNLQHMPDPFGSDVWADLSSAPVTAPAGTINQEGQQPAQQSGTNAESRRRRKQRVRKQNKGKQSEQGQGQQPLPPHRDPIGSYQRSRRFIESVVDTAAGLTAGYYVRNDTVWAEEGQNGQLSPRGELMRLVTEELIRTGRPPIVVQEHEHPAVLAGFPTTAPSPEEALAPESSVSTDPLVAPQAGPSAAPTLPRSRRHPSTAEPQDSSKKAEKDSKINKGKRKSTGQPGEKGTKRRTRRND